MSTQEPLQALRGAAHSTDFWGLDNPRCPHCGVEHSVGRQEWYQIYEEGEHDLTCPSCDLDFSVSTRVSFSFSTDRQECE